MLCLDEKCNYISENQDWEEIARHVKENHSICTLRALLPGNKVLILETYKRLSDPNFSVLDAKILSFTEHCKYIMEE